MPALPPSGTQRISAFVHFSTIRESELGGGLPFVISKKLLRNASGLFPELSHPFLKIAAGLNKTKAALDVSQKSLYLQLLRS